MLTKVFGLTCPSLCSSQQSGDSFALCSPFLLLLPQKSPGPYPRISRWWIQPGVHPLSHQGRINCLSCLAARLVPPLAGAEGHGGSAQWALILQGGQGPLFPWAGAAPLMGLGAPGRGELLSKACTLCLCCAMTGDSSVIPLCQAASAAWGRSQGTWEEGVTVLSGAFRLFPLLGTHHGRKGPRCTHPVSRDVASAGAGAGGELAHARSPAQEGPAWHTRFQQRFISVSVHGPNCLPGMEQGIPFGMERSCLAQAEWKGKMKAGGCRAGRLHCTAQMDHRIMGSQKGFG